MFKRTITLFFAAMASILGITSAAHAQDFPSGTVRLIVPYSAGGGTDLTARIAADLLGDILDTSVIVENRPGAASQVGITYVVNSRADGHTLVWTAADGISVLPAVTAEMPYAIPDDLEFISTFAAFPLVLAVNAELPITNMDEFIAYVKAHPGELNYASSGAGGGGHLHPAAILNKFGLEATHIPYPGASPAAVAVAGGHADFTTVAPSTAAPFVNDGTIRPIATSGSKRTSLFPDLETYEELGYPDLTVDLYYGAYAPAGTPKATIDTLREAIQTVQKDPAVIKRVEDAGLGIFGITGDEFRAFVQKDLDRWTGIAKAIDFQLAPK